MEMENNLNKWDSTNVAQLFLYLHDGLTKQLIQVAPMHILCLSKYHVANKAFRFKTAGMKALVPES